MKTEKRINELMGSPETREVMESNPHFTYGMALGFDIGQCAKKRGNQFEGLSKEEWLNAGDDYATGYRLAFKGDQ